MFSVIVLHIVCFSLCFVLCFHLILKDQFKYSICGLCGLYQNVIHFLDTFGKNLLFFSTFEGSCVDFLLNFECTFDSSYTLLFEKTHTD